MCDINQYKTKELVEELKKRNGIKFIDVNPYEQFKIRTDNYQLSNLGPVKIIAVYD